MRKINIYILLLVLTVLFPAGLWAQTVNKVVAVVNEEIITQQDVDQLLSVLYAQEVQAYKGDELLQKMEELKRDILQQIIEDKLILSRAKEMGVKAREEEVNDKLEYVKNGFPSEEAFYDMLKTQGITIANLKDRYRDQIKIKKLIEYEVGSKISVLPSEVAEYYDRHREEFKKEEKRKVRHILIKAENNVDFELAKVEIDRAYAALKEGADFADVAREYSQGPHRQEGGAMGYVGQGEMLEELDKAIFSLNVGEFSEPIKSSVGYHIFKVEDATSSGYYSLEEAQPAIKKMLSQNKFRQKLKEWLDELKREAYIDIK